MPPSRFLSGAITVAATTLLASACTTGPTGGPSPSGGKGRATVKIGFTSDVTSFDPAKGAGSTDYALTSLLYQPLIGQDEGGTFVPGLAATWTSTPTRTSLTLKKGLTCSDGSALTASQVVASLERYRANSAGALLTFGAANTGKKTAITGDDAAGTVSVTTATPWGEVLAGLSGTAAGIVCEAGLDAGAAALARGAVKGAATGPYEMVTAQRGASYDLRLRKGFKAYPRFASMPAGEPADRLRVQISKNESTLANQLQTGALDLAPSPARTPPGSRATTRSRSNPRRSSATSSPSISVPGAPAPTRNSARRSRRRSVSRRSTTSSAAPDSPSPRTWTRRRRASPPTAPC